MEIGNKGQKTLEVSLKTKGIKEVTLSWQPHDGEKSLLFNLKIQGEPEPWRWTYTLVRGEPLHIAVRLGVVWGLGIFPDMPEEIRQAIKEWADGI